MVTFFPTRAIAVEILGFSIHWYGLMYLTGFLIAFLLLPRLQRYRKFTLSSDDWSALLSWSIIGVLVGGRLGFVFFYEPLYFMAHPLEIVQVWHGGMSSHGGFLGVAIAVYVACRKKNIDPLALADILVVPAAIGLALGRLGNYVNQELYGTVTNLPWAIAVSGVEGLRHPTQFYAIAKDLFSAAVCFWYLRSTTRAGSVIALFLILYGVLRFFVEYVRVQPYGLITLGVVTLSYGQLLTLPLVLAGVFLWWKIRR
ncbi:MAG: prolipoprotein diacylglyceryl transferase [Candidatus Peribacteraceae bacterium]